MGALSKAKFHAENADWKKEPDDPTEEMHLAKMYAAIAQIEVDQERNRELKRIADILEAASVDVTDADGKARKVFLADTGWNT